MWFCGLAMEQKIILKFLYKLRKSAGQIHGMLKQVYGDDTVSLKTLYTSFKKFIDGRGSVEDEHRNGRPTTADNARLQTLRL
ncbi:hypothetical protein AVEN_189811-1 [Araneus ventricosus]|uniref:Mos1 transposase HTH domain-containing protein n=1 Tax=Araneus ventricosus TaxID=182803 RepID=A0A4Y2GJY3_ARAVE|nr:hypothetical protein AVEN_189811-1 [Araneus ventricosus]